jgi:hypothetical protein
MHLWRNIQDIRQNITKKSRVNKIYQYILKSVEYNDICHRKLFWRSNRQNSGEALLLLQNNCHHLGKEFIRISFHSVLLNLKRHPCLSFTLSLLLPVDRDKSSALWRSTRERGRAERSGKGSWGIYVRLKNVGAITLCPGATSGLKFRTSNKHTWFLCINRLHAKLTSTRQSQGHECRLNSEAEQVPAHQLSRSSLRLQAASCKVSEPKRPSLQFNYVALCYRFSLEKLFCSSRNVLHLYNAHYCFHKNHPFVTESSQPLHILYFNHPF